MSVCFLPHPCLTTHTAGHYRRSRQNHRRNHPCQVSSQSVQQFRLPRESKFTISHRLGEWLLQQCYALTCYTVIMSKRFYYYRASAERDILFTNVRLSVQCWFVSKRMDVSSQMLTVWCSRPHRQRKVPTGTLLVRPLNRRDVGLHSLEIAIYLGKGTKWAQCYYGSLILPSILIHEVIGIRSIRDGCNDLE